MACPDEGYPPAAGRQTGVNHPKEVVGMNDQRTKLFNQPVDAINSR